MRPVFEDEQRPVNHRGRIRGDLQFVHGVVEGRVRVHVRAKSHPERLHERGDVAAGEMQCAVEAHMLDEVREPELVVVFKHGTRVHDQPELGAGLRQFVRADVVAQAVRERADLDQRIDRNRLAERRRLGGRGEGRLLRAGEAHRRGEGGDEKCQPDTGAKRHTIVSQNRATRICLF